MRKSYTYAAAILAFLFMQVSGIYAQFSSGNLVVYQIGDGSGALSSSATAVFLKEFTVTGAAGITVNMPTSGLTRLTSSGTATSDGQMTRSEDGQYLVVAGYDAALGTSSVTSSSAATVNRVINLLDNAASITRAASTSSLYSGNNFRSAARSSNNDYWGAGGTTGTHYFGTTAAAATVQSDKTNSRVINIFNGNVYFSTSSSGGSNPNLGIYQVGSGLPVTSGQTITNIINTGAGSSPYAFAINQAGTVIYIADDRNNASGGIQKWSFDGSTWSLLYTLGTGVANIGARGLTVDFSGIDPVIFATTSESSGSNRLIKITDTGAGSSSSTLATSPTNTAFRGVAFAPVAALVIPTVNLSLSSSSGDENGQTVITVTATASSAVQGDQTVDLTVSGSGITAGDYLLSNPTITIPNGLTTGSVTFTVVNDNVVEPTETADLTISNPSSGLVLGGTTTQNISISDFVFTLQVLHASDFEAAVDAVTDAPRFAAIIDTLEGTYANTIKLSSGDNYIPGPFLSSGEDPSMAAAFKTTYERYYNTTFTNPPVNLLPSIGRADISVANFIGIEASALGNHEFDLGTSEVRNIIRGANSGSTTTWFGAQFPYLSANLNFSGDANLSAIATTNKLLPNTAFMSNPSESVSAITNKLKLAPSTVIMKGGQKIGVVGATTQVLASISSPGATTVIGGGANDMTVLAGVLQPVIDSLIADGCNKIILLSHLQQIAFEKELAGKLSGVDIIIAGGSNTLMADGTDRLRTGDVSVETYPYLTTGLDAKPLAVINTEGNYKYVGRLVVGFDADGTLIPSSIDSLISGVYAADDQGVNDAWGANITNAFAIGTRGNQVQVICDAIGNVITVKDGNIFGKTSVFLEGRRTIVRTEETNLGDLTAEANLWMAKFYEPSTVISIKNGGGIRSAIGNIIADGSNVILAPPIANPSAGKLEGDISQLDIENSLRFNNQLSLLTLTASGMRSILEHTVAGTTPTSTPGQFGQVAGVRYSYDFNLPVGSRILNAVVTDSIGNISDTLVLNGVTHGDLARTFRVVTLNFLANGGDGYPFNTLGTNRVDLNTLSEQGPAAASFTNAGSEQDAFAEYMKNQFTTTPYSNAETPLTQDCRIQRVPARADNVLPPNPGTNDTLVICNGTNVTEAQLFAALGGSPDTGGTWSPTLAGAGVYTYTVTSPSCAGSASATVTVIESAKLTITLINGGAIACVGGTTTMTVTASGGTEPYSGTGVFTVSSGPRTYTVTDANGCTASASFTLLDGTFTAPSVAPSRIIVSDNGNLCNTTITATCTAVPNAVSYNWIAPAGTTILSGQGTQTITLNISDSFTEGALTVSGSNACGSGPVSAPRNLRAKPSKPVISGPSCVSPNESGIVYDVLNPEPGVVYTWQAPTGAAITAGQGTSSVTIDWRTNQGLLKCTPSSVCATGNRASFAISTTGCNDFATAANSDWIVYPNPTAGSTKLLFTAKGDVKYQILISDLAGKILMTKELVVNAGRQSINLDLETFATGMYLVTVMSSQNEKQVFKVLKQ
jgi:2',3'-cyclic-nucleotide 2'-phosphodiesterase (5'-nucleotidase family)